jgi:arabinose-5-phosphate isomerase
MAAAHLSLKERLNIYRDALKGLENRWEADWTSVLQACAEARRLVFCGTGKSGYVARKLTATAHGLGMSAAFLSPAEALHGDLGMLQEGDMLVAISNSGNGLEWQALLESTHFLSFPMLALLGSKQGALAHHAQWIFDCKVPREADFSNLSPSTSTLVAQVCGECLLYALAEHRQFDATAFAKIHPGGQLGRKLHIKVSDVMHVPSKVAVVLPEEGFREVILAMTEKPLGAAVVFQNKHMLGIITEGDIRRALIQHHEVDRLKAKDIMNQSPVTIAPDARLSQALELMENRPSPISVLPVMQNQQWLGIIRLHDVY